MDTFPTSINELPLIFNLYSTLIQSFNDENTIKDKSLLFDKYKLLNDELFNVLDEEKDQEFIEGSLIRFENNNQQKMKNHNLLYILYYYSVLLYNKDHLPYPKFLFVHDLIRKHFGGYRTVVTKEDIKKFEKNEQNEIIYKSEVFNNDKDLLCSFKLINNAVKKEKQKPTTRGRQFSRSTHFYIAHTDYTGFGEISEFIGENENENEVYERKNDEIINKSSCKILIHQLNDDQIIEIVPTGDELVHVSFPLQILICSTDGSKELENIEAFVIDFSPSEEQQKQFFVDNYDDIQEDFNKFIELGQYDNEISKIALATKENQDNSSSNNNDNSNQDNFIDNANQFDDDDINNYDDFDDDFIENHHSNDDAFKFYKLDQIPREIAFQPATQGTQIKSNIISLRCNFLHYYGYLIESINSIYSNDEDYSPFEYTPSTKSYWILPLSSKDKLQNQYPKQILRPAFSMNTESKFRFINQIFMGREMESTEITIEFNRFEQQKFMEKFEKNNKNENNVNNKKAVKSRPLIIQLMEQIDVDSLSQMRVLGDTPFRVTLIGENPVDLRGPGRELFSSLIMEIVNDHIGIFTFNPNRKHDVELTNQEDMIPNKNSNIKSFYFDDNVRNNDYYLFDSRFIYAGALLATCIVSDLPQQMKLASFIWEFLSSGTISIESIYEIDNNFKQIIESAEKIQKKIITRFFN